MRHGKVLRKFSRTPAHRRAMLRNMATSLLQHEKLETTVHKAKDLRRVVEKLITLGGEDTLAHRRQAGGYLKDKAVVHKLFTEVGPRYKRRPGGYTRVIRTRRRAGDAAEMAVIELVEAEFTPKKKSASRARPRAEEVQKEASAATQADAAVEAESQADAPEGSTAE